MPDLKTDPRVTPKGKAIRQLSVKSPRAWLYRERADKNTTDTELLHGHCFAVHKTRVGWLYGKALTPVPNDNTAGYVGWMRRDDLSVIAEPTHRVISLKAPVFETANIKSHIATVLPMGSLVHNQNIRSETYPEFIEILEGFIHVKHLAAHSEDYSDDFAAIAQSHLGLPYIWAGVSSDGLDCSGLVQSSLRAAGRDAPRDADMQEAELGEVAGPPYQRGDLIFWPGHVGIMVSPDRMIHANAYHMRVATEPLSEAVARIGPFRTVKRL